MSGFSEDMKGSLTQLTNKDSILDVKNTIEIPKSEDGIAKFWET